MKISIPNQRLKPILKRIAAVVPRKAVLPALEMILVETKDNKLILHYTDLEITVSCEVPMADGVVVKDDKLLIPFQWLKGISDLHESEILTIDLYKSKAEIEASSGTYRQDIAVKLTDYPALPAMPDSHKVAMIDGFAKWLKAASKVCVFSEATPSMNMVYLELIGESMIMTATDANALFTHQFAIDKVFVDTAVLVSQKVVGFMEGLTDISMHYNDDLYSFSSESISVYAKRPEHKFPAYNSIIPKADTTNLRVNRDALIAVLDKAAFINADVVSIKPTADQLIFTVKNERKQEAVLHCECFGNTAVADTTIMVQTSKLQTILSQIQFSFLGLTIVNATPLIVTNSEDMSYIGLLTTLKF